jgi:hypothetical protein
VPGKVRSCVGPHVFEVTLADVVLLRTGAAAMGKVRPLVLLQVIEIADPDFAHWAQTENCGGKVRPLRVNAGGIWRVSGKPVLNFQAADAFELVGVGGHDRGTTRTSVGSDQQIVAADRRSARFQL